MLCVSFQNCTNKFAGHVFGSESIASKLNYIYKTVGWYDACRFASTESFTQSRETNRSNHVICSRIYFFRSNFLSNLTLSVSWVVIGYLLPIMCSLSLFHTVQLVHPEISREFSRVSKSSPRLTTVCVRAFQSIFLNPFLQYWLRYPPSISS